MIQNSEKMIYFNFSYFALRLLGKGLYSNHWTAIAELVANGLDAQASSVKIYFNMIDKQHSTIEIFDNGIGMDYKDLSEKYVLIGKDKREDSSVSDSVKKKLMGRKGIGKLAALYLSNKYFLISKKYGKNSTAWCLDASIVKDSDIPRLIRCNESDVGIECMKEWEKLSQGTIIKLTNVDLTNFGERTLEAFKARLADFYLTDSLDSNIEICVIDSPNKCITFEKVYKSIAYKNFYAFYNNTSMDFFDKLSKFVYFPSEIPEIMEKKRAIDVIDPQKFVVRGKKKFLLKNGTMSDKEFEYSLEGWIGIHASIKKEDAVRNDPNYLRNKVYRPNQLRLYVRKKLAVENFLDYVKNTQAFSNYIEGEISFDILDDNDLGDIATSNRQGFVENDERVQLLVNILKPIINSLIRSRVSIGSIINNEEKAFIEDRETRLKQDKLKADRKRMEAEARKFKEEQLRREAEHQKALEKKRADTLNVNLNSEKKRSDFLFDSLDDNQIDFAKKLHMLKINSSIIEKAIKVAIMKIQRKRFTEKDSIETLKKISYQNQRIQAVLSYSPIAKFNTKAEYAEGDLFVFIDEYCRKVLDRNEDIQVSSEIINSSSFITKFVPQDIVIIVDNILSNSVKHHAKKLRIIMNCIEDYASIEFSDNGDGINSSVENVDELFEFGKGYTSTGTGVGLYHIKDIIVNKLDGEVSIVSEPKNGFSLYVRLRK